MKQPAVSQFTADLAQAGPANLATLADARFRRPPHIDRIDRELTDAIARSMSREDERPEILLVEVPPRHGKSTIISEYTPAWYVGTFPDRRVILASYEADFASTWGAKARNHLEDFGRELYGVRVNQRSKSAKRWDLERQPGGMVTAGVGGPITGKGAHLLIVDDPVKNAEQAMSETIREKHWDWWLSTARTRLEPGALVAVLMTRWHEADLGGRMLQAAEDGGDPVTELRFPALALEGDPLGREPGEALWPDRYSAEYLAHTKEVLGAYWWAAMYQGTPTPDEGGIFDRRHFRYFDLTEDGAVLRYPDGDTKLYGFDWLRKLTYVDLAISEKETADYTVATEIWVTPEADMLVRAVSRDRIPGPDQADFLETHQVGVLKVEEIGYQAALIKQLARRGVAVEPVYPDKDKVTRASAAGALYKGGKVYHLAGAEWLADFEHELLAFPAGEHDDQVDTIAYAARDLPGLVISRRKGQKKRGKTMTGGLMTREM
jgi:predicted phage terminase large subunit-like protein